MRFACGREYKNSKYLRTERLDESYDSRQTPTAGSVPAMQASSHSLALEMPKSRLTIAVLALAALLGSRLFSTMHVGCHLATADALSQEKVGPLDGTADLQPHCCCEHHACPQPGTDAPGKSPCEEHDSDDCVVCQAFYTSRHGITLPSIVSVLIADCSNYVRIIFSVSYATGPPRGFQSRGPPAIS